MSIEKVVDALNGAFAADPSAIHALIVNRVPCNQALADDPFVQVDCPPVLRDGLFQVGAIGLINGVLAAIGLPLAATMFSYEKDSDGRSKLIGFTVYKPVQSEVAAIQSPEPQPDQYWQHKKSGDRAYFIGRTPEGTMVWQCEGDNVEIGNLDWSGWEHLQGCDSWEWKQSPVVAEPVAAKAPSDVMGQSADDWVTLTTSYDDCQLRPGYQYRPCATPVIWRTVVERDSLCGKLIKDERYDASGDWEFRCRRSDLPVVNARIPVALYWYDGAIVGRYADSPVTDPSFVPIHSDGNGGWFIERSEDAGN